MKRAARLSRFSMNANPDLLKNMQSFISRETLDEKDKNPLTNDLLQSLTTTKRSIILDDRRMSRGTTEENREGREEDLFSKEATLKKDKYYDVDEINKYRRCMMELVSLQEKNKKTKYKFITAEFIEFLFQTLKCTDTIKKLLSSSVPHDSVINEFFNILPGFQLSKVEGGRTLQLTREDDFFHVLIDGAAEKVYVKQSYRSERKSSISQQSGSENSIVRRSKLKNKTVTERGKMVCFENQLPQLANEKELAMCTVKTIGNCTFLMLDKGVWAKFLLALQKLQEKHLVGFIKHCTTINLNTYNKRQPSKESEEKTKRRRFMQPVKFPNDHSDSQSDTDQAYNKAVERKSSTQPRPMTSSYKLVTLSKDDKLNVNYQDIYLVAKGSVFLTTDSYSMVISEGSIINSSVLMLLGYREVRVKALSEALVVRILLEHVYLTRKDEKQFVAKIQQIQQFRSAVNAKHHPQFQDSNNLTNAISTTGNLNTNPSMLPFTHLSEKHQKFQPKDLIIKDLHFTKAQQSKKSPSKQRINHCKKFHTEYESHETQLARKVALKYANNFCIFQKIVQSEQKVIEAYNINKVKRLFSIQDLFKNINFNKFIQKQHYGVNDQQKKTNSHKHQPTENNKLINEKDKQNDKQNDQGDQSHTCRNLTKDNLNNSHKRKNKQTLQTLRKRRQIFGRSLMQKKKKQKAKVIDNLFEITLTDQHQKTHSADRSLRRNSSLNFHQERIKQIVNRNSLIKSKDLKSERTFLDLRASHQETSDLMNTTESQGKRSKYSRQFLVTDPNYAEVRNLQKVISGQNVSLEVLKQKFGLSFKKTYKPSSSLRQMNWTCCDDGIFSEEFVKLRKQATKRIQTTMLTGRIRQSKVSN